MNRSCSRTGGGGSGGTGCRTRCAAEKMRSESGESVRSG